MHTGALSGTFYVPVVPLGKPLEFSPVAVQGQKLVKGFPLRREVMLHGYQSDVVGAEIERPQDFILAAFRINAHVIYARRSIGLLQEIAEAYRPNGYYVSVLPVSGVAVGARKPADGREFRKGCLVEFNRQARVA